MFTTSPGLPDSGKSWRRAHQEAASEGQRSQRWKHQLKCQRQVSGGELEFYYLHQRGAPAGLCAHCIGTRGERPTDQSRPTSSPPRVGSSPPKPHAYPHSLTVTQSHTARAASRPQMGGWQCQWPPTTPPGTCPVLPSTSVRSESERVAPCKSCYHLDELPEFIQSPTQHIHWGEIAFNTTTENVTTVPVN